MSLGNNFYNARKKSGLSLDELIEFDIDVKEIQAVIDRTNDTVSEKVDWANV